LLSAVSGILMASYFNVVPGPLVVISGIIIFVVAIIIRRRLKITS
jgi:ABC-type Mn2+/Zn2+ transport system permease subunit